jgi:hypothetical protein
MIKAILLLGCAAVFAHARPVVFWVSDPINPGETALLFGDGIGAKVSAQGWRVADSGPQPAAEKLAVLQASDVSAKVVIPANWKPGLFAIRLRNGSEDSEPIYLNRTEPWWWIGGAGHVAFTGEEVRVFGKNFGPGSTAWLEAEGRKLPLRVRKTEKYTVRFEVPASAVPGEYRLWTSNGFGGPTGMGTPMTLPVARRQAWPSSIYSVRAFGATGDGEHDDTAGFRAALAKAREEGGGVVFVPRGTYRITGKLAIPEKTVLRGEKREWVWLYVPKDAPAFDSVLAGNRDFAVEELSVVSQTTARLIAAPDHPAIYNRLQGTTPPAGQMASNVRLQRLRLHHLHFAHRLNKGDPRREEAEGPATVVLSGNDISLTDSEIIGAGMPIAVHGAKRLRIERNTLATGRNGWYGLWDTSEVTMEGNTIEGRDLEGTYGGFQNTNYRLYFAGNQVGPAYGNEREALTFDSPYAPTWMGRVARVEGRSLEAAEYNGDPKRWKPGELRDQVCLIAYGKGLGQYIPIADNTETTITLAKEWTIPPDSSSHLVVRVNRSEIVVTANRFRDASASPQLYAQTYGVIVDGNTAERTGGSYGLAWDFWWQARDRRRYSTCMFNQWLNNDFKEGFIYQQGPWLHGFLGVAANPGNGTLDPPAASLVGNVIRNNRVTDDFTIGARLDRPHNGEFKNLTAGYLGRDTVIEGNHISSVALGIEVAQGYIDTLVRNNQIEGCAKAIEDRGMNTWKDVK